MRKIIGCLIALSTILASGCVVKVNGKVHKFGLSGEETTEPGKTGEPGSTSGEGGETNPDALAAELAGAATPSGQTVTLKGGFSPNPTLIGTYSSKAEVSTSGAPHGASNCYGYVGEEPAVVLNLTSAMANTRISAPGAGLILAEFGDRKYICREASYGSGAPSVVLDPEWPAGEIKLFVGGQQGKTYNYEIRVEDEKRPLDIAWKDKVKPVDLSDMPKDPIIVSEITPKSNGVKNGNCEGAFFRDTPDMAFVLKRPLADFTVEVRSAKPIAVQVVGPLTEDGRNIPTRCLSQERMTYNRLEAGHYALRVGTPASGDEVLYHVLMRGKDTSRNPVFVPTKFAETIALQESVVTFHFPQLLNSDLENSESNRESIFLSSPKAMFVFPKFNMDKSVAQILGGATPIDAKTPLEYPKENEPLLLLDAQGTVMAADGSMFRVNMKDLQDEPSAAIAVPAAPRNMGMPFDRAFRSAGPEDAKAVAAYQAAQKAEDACHDRQRSSVEGGFESACAGLEKATEKKKETLEKDLLKTRTARRAASLAKIKPRLEGFFKK